MGKWSGAVCLLSVLTLLSSCQGLEGAAEIAEKILVAEEAQADTEAKDILREETSDVIEGAPEGAESIQEGSERIQEASAADSETAAYAWSILQSEEERLLYQEMLRALQEREEETVLSTRDADLLEPVFQCVMADHPEIFYVDGYTSTCYSLGEELRKITFSPDYTMEEAEIERRSALLETALEEWLSGMPDEGDYEKAKYLYDYLISHTEYELDSPDSQNICSVLLNGRSVCQGYAKAYQLLCQRAGIEAFLVTGMVQGQRHAWDLILVDDQWYYVDPTWGDASYRQEGEEYPASAYPTVNYDYFCVTTQQISLTHSLSEAILLPECTAVEAQYYRREGLYLETAEEKAVEAVIRKAWESGADTVTFQCADDEIYEAVYRLLIEEQKIFEYLPALEGKVAYADSPLQRTFSFWLSE